MNREERLRQRFEEWALMNVGDNPDAESTAWEAYRYAYAEAQHEIDHFRSLVEWYRKWAIAYYREAERAKLINRTENNS